MVSRVQRCWALPLSAILDKPSEPPSAILGEFSEPKWQNRISSYILGSQNAPTPPAISPTHMGKPTTQNHTATHKPKQHKHTGQQVGTMTQQKTGDTLKSHVILKNRPCGAFSFLLQVDRPHAFGVGDNTQKRKHDFASETDFF